MIAENRINDEALEWLRKQMTHKLRSLYNAEKRPGVTEEELNNIREHIQLINYTIMKLEGNEEESVC